MKITIRNIDQMLELNPDRILTLVLENKHLFREVLADLARTQLDSVEYSIVNCQNDSIQEMLLVSDVLGFDLASRKILAELYKRASHGIDEEILLTLQKLEFELEKLAIMVEAEVGIEINYKTNFELIDFLKLLKIEPAIGGEFDVKKRLYGIIDLASRLFPGRPICLVNFKQLLTKDEFADFCKYCVGHQRLVWCLESSQSYRVTEEEIVVVDEDLFSYKQA